MNEETPKAITFNNKEYLIDDMSKESLRLIEHLMDLDIKLRKAILEVEQLQLVQDTITKLLEKQLEKGESESESEEETTG